MRASDQCAGAWSIMTGIAANHSMENDCVIRVDDLMPGLLLPEYPVMPSADEPLPIREQPDPTKQQN